MGTFQYFDQEFTFAEEIDQFAVVEFAEAVDNGIEAEGLRGMAVAWRLALGCVAEDDQARFRQVSRKNKAKADDYLAVFRDRLAADAERPTQAPADSSAGPVITEEKSESQLADGVTPLPARAVRPDLALAASRSRSA